MKASQTSIHARLYKFTYQSDLPTNLCPYFWKLVFALLVFVPNLILQLPYIIMISMVKPDEHYDCFQRRCGGGCMYVVMAIFIFWLFVTYNWILAVFNAYSYDYRFANGGWFLNLFIFGLLIYEFRNKIIKLITRGENKKPKSDHPNIISEFVKAKYNKYCPQMEWVSKEEPQK